MEWNVTEGKRYSQVVDFGLDAEVVYIPEGIALAGCGVDEGNVNGDGWPDFVITNFNARS